MKNDEGRMIVGLNFEHLSLKRRLLMAWHIVYRRFAFVEVPTANVAMIGLEEMLGDLLDGPEDDSPFSTRPRKDDDKVH